MLVWLTGSRKSKWNLKISWREIPDWGFLARLEYFENSFYSYNPEKKSDMIKIAKTCENIENGLRAK